MDVVYQNSGFVHGFNFQICGKPLLSCTVAGIHWYLYQLCLMFLLAQIKARFNLSIDNKAKKNSRCLSRQSINSYMLL